MNEILETDMKQRAYDGKWELLGKIKDFENTYSYKTESGITISLIPEKWITVNVYDYLLRVEEWV
jgi:hypothetical protein